MNASAITTILCIHMVQGTVPGNLQAFIRMLISLQNSQDRYYEQLMGRETGSHLQSQWKSDIDLGFKFTELASKDCFCLTIHLHIHIEAQQILNHLLSDFNR